MPSREPHIPVLRRAHHLVVTARKAKQGAPVWGPCRQVTQQALVHSQGKEISGGHYTVGSAGMA